jgi:RHS repeat-associated protein
VEKRIRLNADDVEPTWVQYEYKDGHQREYQRRTLAENGKWAVGAQQRFNSKGRKAGEHDAYFSDSHEFEADPPGGVASCRWSYDAFGRMIREVHYNGGVSLIKFEGPVTSYYSPLISGLLDDAPDTKPTRRIFRDAWNRAVEITEYGAHEQVTYFHNYDPLDRIASIVHGPTGIQTHRYVYDLTGRSIRIRSVDAGTKTIIRDALFNEVMTTDADNRVLYKEYDPRGRVTKTRKDGPAGEVLTTFDYDGNETDNVIGRLRRVTAAWGGAEYVYTHDGKVARVIRTFAGHTPAYTVEYGYNSQGNPTFVRYPDGTLLDYAYNAAGLLESISGVIDNIDYNATGKRVRIAYANGVETAFEYTDGDYMINEIRTINAASATAYQHLVYHLDAAGQVSAIEDRATVAGKVRNNQSFTYDLRHQLVRATGQGAAGAYDYRYEYDLFGNMTRNDEAEGDAIRYGLQEGILAHPNRMVRRIGDGADFDYDQSGNLIKTPELSEIQYCSRHRPIMIERSDGTVVEYVYDHDGRRIRTTVTKDGVSHVEYNVENLFYIQGATTTKVVFDLNKKAAILPSAGDGILFHIDRQGNNNILTNLSTGAYIGQNEYTPYGRLSVSMVIMPNFSFQQSEFSVDVQMVLLGARHYLPRQGRFLVPDAYLLQNPEKLKMFLIGYNLYTYGNNNPINYIDPSGNFVFLLAGVLTVLAYVLIAAVVVGAVAGIISAAVNGAQTWDEWLLSIVAGIVGAILVTLVGFWIGGVPGAIVALSIFMIASWIGAPLTRALDETDSEVAWFFSFLIKWIQSPVLTTIGLFVVLGYAIAGHDVDLERGALFVNVGGSSGGALTLGAIVYANGGNFDAGGDVNDDLARHEAYHTRQVAAFGEMGFYLTYIILGTIWGAGEAGEPFGTDLRGCGNPFEKTARTYNHPEASPTPTPTGQC